ncbi:MAG TPA: choice-of-anchor Q domain-containing protein [Ferruginibacter sp.]|jgi:hypothetical protein|nr:choice-of-anchor Q domain-containing protein [Ferruginibacter sp.]
MIKRIVKFSLLFIIFCVMLFSCKKDSFITSGNAALSTSVYNDTLKYDTVFTSVGSITQSFKIFNLNNQKLLLSKVKLMGGDSSSFKININGDPASEVDNIEVDANDSIYVFVTVNINPNNANTPFIVSDSILISYNGNNKYVQLQAYGQNAHFFNNKVISADTTWTNDLPYVILGSLTVSAATTLTIQQGCRIYAHATAPFLVNGTLLVNGTKQDSVVFTGDRLDAAYKDLPASWPGIYFYSGSANSVLTFAIIKNANQGIEVDSLSATANPKLTLHQCIIDNAFGAGILCNNGSVSMDNSLISNCGSNIVINSGGDYNFTNCTVAAYSTPLIEHSLPVLQVSNTDSSQTITNNLSATFLNSIFWGDGSIPDEVTVNKHGSSIFTVSLSHCIYRVIDQPANVDTLAVIENDPRFDSIDVNNNIYNFHTTNAASPGIDKGLNTSFPSDLDNNPRIINSYTDIGCYEKQ